MGLVSGQSSLPSCLSSVEVPKLEKPGQKGRRGPYFPLPLPSFNVTMASFPIHALGTTT